MNEFGVLTLLLIGHVLGDFYLQPAGWVIAKQRKRLRAPQLYLHALVHTGLTALVLLLTLSVSAGTLLVLSGVVCVTHAAIDAVKAYAKPTAFPFLLDQLAHGVVLVTVWALATEQAGPLFAVLSLDTFTYRQGVVVAAYLLVLTPASVIIKLLLSPWSDAAETSQHDPTMAFAGQRIGYLERVLVLTFILLNQLTAVGFLLAAKSIFRFGDLSKQRDRAMTEYVLLGTLTSFAITIGIGLIASALVSGLPMGNS